MAPLLSVLEYFDQTNRTLVQRIPPHGLAKIHENTPLIVQPHQAAVIVTAEVVRETFGPGRHTLSPEALPLTTDAPSGDWEREPPELELQVCFVGKQDFVEQKWATTVPVRVQDAQFGETELRGFGRFSFRVENAPQLVQQLIESEHDTTTTACLAKLRNIIVAQLTGALSHDLSLRQLARGVSSLTEIVRDGVADEFQRLGVELIDFGVNSISFPGDIEERLSTEMAQSLQSFVKQAAQRQTSAATEPRELIREVARSAGWDLDDSVTPWQISLSIGAFRRQRVRVTFDRVTDEGSPTIGFASICGPASDRHAMLFLRCNANTVHGAFAVEQTSGGEMFVVESNQLAATADSREIARAIASIAWQADRIEGKLSLVDEH